MKVPTKIIATALAASLATSSLAAPASAFFFPWPPHCWWCHPPHPPKPPAKPTGDGINKAGPLIVGCIAGSAFSLIALALYKGQVYKSKTVELTNEEAWQAWQFCGLRGLAVAAKIQQGAK